MPDSDLYRPSSIFFLSSFSTILNDTHQSESINHYLRRSVDRSVPWSVPRSVPRSVQNPFNFLDFFIPGAPPIKWNNLMSVLIERVSHHVDLIRVIAPYGNRWKLQNPLPICLNQIFPANSSYIWLRTETTENHLNIIKNNNVRREITLIT